MDVSHRFNNCFLLQVPYVPERKLIVRRKRLNRGGRATDFVRVQEFLQELRELSVRQDGLNTTAGV
jgi:hypothetical protein